MSEIVDLRDILSVHDDGTVEFKGFHYRVGGVWVVQTQLTADQLFAMANALESVARNLSDPGPNCPRCHGTGIDPQRYSGPDNPEPCSACCDNPPRSGPEFQPPAFVDSWDVEPLQQPDEPPF